MENEFTKPVLRTRETPVQILTEDYPRHHWPISGGWGYEMDDAVVIETENSADGVALEYKFLEYRTYEEMIVFQPQGQGYAGFRFKRGMQMLCGSKDDTKHYDHITMNVTCFKEADWDMLKADWESHNGYEDDEEGRVAHIRLRNSKQISFETSAWFDITNFFGK